MKPGGYLVRLRFTRIAWELALLGFAFYVDGWSGAGLIWLGGMLGYATAMKDHRRSP